MNDIEYKIKKIGKLMGKRSVFRIGVDSKNNRIDLLSVDVCSKDKQAKEEIEEVIPAYIG